jgi:hypothetical protein
MVIGPGAVEPGPAGGEEPPASTGGRAHPHEWCLRAVTHEDFHAVEEYRCGVCGEVVFRDA